MTEKQGIFEAVLLCHRPENSHISPPSSHSREPEKRIRHLPVRRKQTGHPVPDQAPDDTSAPGQYSNASFLAGRYF